MGVGFGVVLHHLLPAGRCAGRKGHRTGPHAELSGAGRRQGRWHGVAASGRGWLNRERPGKRGAAGAAFCAGQGSGRWGSRFEGARAVDTVAGARGGTVERAGARERANGAPWPPGGCGGKGWWAGGGCAPGGAHTSNRVVDSSGAGFRRGGGRNRARGACWGQGTGGWDPRLGLTAAGGNGGAKQRGIRGERNAAAEGGHRR